MGPNDTQSGIAETDSDISETSNDHEARVSDGSSVASELFKVTLSSIGDAVISTDADGRVTFMNPIAENLTGWTLSEAAGKSLTEIFHIVNETTREPVENPALRALKTGTIVGLANHTVLIARDGTEHAIDDSAAPIKREGNDHLFGAVLIFRDITERRASEEAAAKYTAIVESSDDAIVSKNLDGVVTSWNQGAENIFGYTAEEMIGSPIYRIIPEELHAEEDEVLARLRRGEKISHFETTRRTKNGRDLSISLSVSPVRDSQGDIIGAAKVARDFTEQRKAEASLRDTTERLRLALEAGNMGSWEWNSRSNSVIWSSSLETIYGLAPGNFPGTLEAALSYIDPSDRQMVQSALKESIDDGSDLLIEYRIKRDDGSRRWIEARGRKIEQSDGDDVRLVGVCADITDRRNTEDSLRLIAAELSEADRRKNEFLAMLAHELRNPLAPIRNALQIMKLSGEGGVRLHSAANMMERQVGQLVRLVDDLLDVSRISRGKIELRLDRVDLAGILEQSIEAARPSCETGDVALNLYMPDEPVYLRGDAARLTQLIGNLLNNGCKFTERGGRIDVTVERDRGLAVISVKDTGIGIAPEQIDSIFDMFVQADTSLERTASGLGIGLTLVKNLTEMHGGSVEARSEGIGRGSEFIVRLPLMSAESPARTESKKSRKKEVRDSKILVVDDNIDSADSLSMLLQISGYEVQKAHDGRQAVEMAGSFRPDVVLLDIGLPLLNGYEAAQTIRKQAWGEKMVLFALTGWGQQEDRERSKQAGFDVHLVKPIDHDELMHKLEEFTSNKSD
jgi:PAS domain S-box-containing protein